MKLHQLLEAKKDVVTLQTRVIRIFKATKVPDIIRVGTGYKVQQGAKQVKDLGLGLTVQMWTGGNDVFDLGSLHADPEVAAKIREKMIRRSDDNAQKKHDAFKALAKHVFDEIMKLGVIKVGYKRNRIYEYVDAKDADKAFDGAFLSTGFSVRFIWPEDAESGTQYYDHTSTMKVNDVIRKQLATLLKNNNHFRLWAEHSGVVVPSDEYIQQLVAKYPDEFLRFLDVNYGPTANPKMRLKKATGHDLRRFAMRVALKNDRKFVKTELQKIADALEKKQPGKTEFKLGTLQKGYGENPEKDVYFRYRQPDVLARFEAKNVYTKRGA